jgi:hypothetical protein
LFISFFVLIFSATFITAWNFYFPTPTERFLWRGVSLYILVFGFWGSAIFGLWEHVFRRRKRAARSKSMEEASLTDQKGRAEKWRKRFRSLADGARNNSPDKDPNLEVPLSMMIPITITCAIYVVCRGYVWFEDLFSLRCLPETAYATVNWSIFFPHL